MRHQLKRGPWDDPDDDLDKPSVKKRPKLRPHQELLYGAICDGRLFSAKEMRDLAARAFKIAPEVKRSSASPWIFISKVTIPNLIQLKSIQKASRKSVQDQKINNLVVLTEVDLLNDPALGWELRKSRKTLNKNNVLARLSSRHRHQRAIFCD
ncbi:hypothetical protein BCR34DRAFT_601688 [Clohesyomyces aquaticus]|uniref:Uncharacterized protein n=1 Tax=Clohesyomyces aquaticus TaxID=1231657 RepID=A0A1Y1ZKZ3_9PLEO|nr:hypothetical protein BCR34DRAFT_601688 [Clohesyomyces aquaticus]